MVGKPKPEKRKKKDRKPVKKVSSKGALIKKAHALMREIVIARDGGCVCPPPVKGHSPVLQAGHIIRSVHGGCRWSLYNVHCQCASCNSRHTRDWDIYEGWFIDTFGIAAWLAVKEEKKNEGLKPYELEELIEQFRLIREKQTVNPEWKPYYTQREILSGAWDVERRQEKHDDQTEA